MSVEIQPIEAVGAEISNEKIKVTDYGVEVLSSLTPQEWCESVQTIGKYHSKAQFYLGDLVVYAEGINNTWGEKYDELVELTGYDKDTLARFASVCRKFPREFREEVGHVTNNFPPFHNFRMVSSLDLEVAKYFLQTAGEAGWSTRKLAEEVARYKNNGELPETFEDPIGYKSWKEQARKMLKGYVPERIDEEYDEVSWLIEVRDWAEERLHELGVE